MHGLAPKIGYDSAAAIAHLASESGETIKQVALRETDLSSDELDRILDPMDDDGAGRRHIGWRIVTLEVTGFIPVLPPYPGQSRPRPAGARGSRVRCFYRLTFANYAARVAATKATQEKQA